MLSNALRFQAFQRRVTLLIVAVFWLIAGCGWAIGRVSDRYSYSQNQQLKKYHQEIWHENQKPHEK